jgi:hypothetical protein
MIRGFVLGVALVLMVYGATPAPNVSPSRSPAVQTSPLPKPPAPSPSPVPPPTHSAQLYCQNQTCTSAYILLDGHFVYQASFVKQI